MKILMLGWELPPHNSGGLGVACYQLCRALADNGADIEFILPYTPKQKPSFMKLHSTQSSSAPSVAQRLSVYDSAHYTGDDSHHWHDIFGQHSTYEKTVLKLVNEQQYDIIHAHDWLTFRAALRAKEAAGLPFIAHVHSIESDRAGGGPGNYLVREIEENALLLADRVVAVSQHTKHAMMREYGIPGSKIDVVHNSFDRQLLEPAAATSEYRYLNDLKANGYHVVASVGRLTIQKGLPSLLKAFRLVVDHLPKTMLLVVGSGEQYHELIALSATLGLSKQVVFTDFQRGQRYRQAYEVADLFVMPSISEPFGLTPLEAIGYGTPTLISRQAGVAEVLHNTLTCDHWDTHHMANAMVGALRHKSLRHELLKNATAESSKLSWDGAAQQMLGLYDRQLTGAVA